MMVTTAMLRPGENSTVGSLEATMMEKLSETSSKVSSLKGMLKHLVSMATDPTGNTTVWGVGVKSNTASM